MVEFYKNVIGLTETGREKDTIYLSTSVDNHSIEARGSPKQKTPGFVATRFSQCGATTKSEKRAYPVGKAPLIGFAGVFIATMSTQLNAQLSAIALADIAGHLGMSHCRGSIRALR